MSDAHRTLTLSTGALHGLRAAALGAPDGAQRLRDAGEIAGFALFDDFAAVVHATFHVFPEALPIAQFTDQLASILSARGWGTAVIDAATDAAVLRVASADWVEAEPDAAAPAPTCHFSAGLFAGFFGRAAGAPLAVREVRCRSAGAARCEFVVGSPGAVARA